MHQRVSFDLTALTEVILAHGGDARGPRDVFAKARVADQEAIIKFLKTLQVLPEGSPLVVTGGS